MFKRFFGRDEEEEEEVYETVDPVLEQRRKEKFSTPLIYNDEEEEKQEKPKETRKEVKKSAPKPAAHTAPSKRTPPPESTYQMSQIISPMTGVQEVKRPEPKVTRPKTRKKYHKEVDELVPVISPFFGPSDAEEEVVKPKKKEKKVEKTPASNEPSVTQNLRNIAQIAEEEQDQLKIIEERTGKFKLDLQSEDGDSFIDEIDDSMSLDELMSLYEKKFKD